MTAAAAPSPPAPPVGLSALFHAFLIVSLCGFGGPIVWARRILVERRHLLDDREFAEIMSLCQFLPGPNVVSIAVCVGAKFRGLAGTLAALSGFLIIPWSIGFALGTVILRLADFGALQHALRGISAAAAGLIIATGIRLLMPFRRRPAALLCAGLGFIGLALARLPLLLVLLVLVPLSIAAAGRQPAPGR